MNCPQCAKTNDADALHCKACGTALVICCTHCVPENRPQSRHCRACGHDLDGRPENRPAHAGDAVMLPMVSSPMKTSTPVNKGHHVTVLYSDLCDDETLRERLDPEEVQEIRTFIFGVATKVVAKYEGFVDKFMGDAIMAVFGAACSRTGDPVRAIRAAREINHQVAALNAKFEKRAGRPLAMHAGINTETSLVGDFDCAPGTHRLSGDTINVAARLSRLGTEGDVLVGPDTFLHAQDWFEFEMLPPVAVKDKFDPVPVYRVASSCETPSKVRGLYGLRARLIGRQRELERLTAAARQIEQGEGGVVVITGAAGTGKSRLIEEFKARIDMDAIQWFEGHAYPYARNIPYAPLINILGSACGIAKGDDPAAVRQKIDMELATVLGLEAAARPYVGSLFDLHYDELKNTSPEAWKKKLHQAVITILDRLAIRRPTIICIEDLHWADPSFVDLVRHIAVSEYMPVLLICSYRPMFTLMDKSRKISRTARLIEIELHDLPPNHTVEMLLSLLDTAEIPDELRRLVNAKVEGNPFYLEEMVNAMIAKQTLTRAENRWQISRPIDQADYSSTIHGVVSGRLDHLQRDAKRLLQEAAVIGRVFHYDILKQITAGVPQLDQSLNALEHFDMIRSRNDAGVKQYAFKHALVQEVVYNGIVKKDRRGIHEKVALNIESMFSDRLSPYYETLAFHFAMGHSTYKAVDYLVKSGTKSMRRYAVDEAHHHFQQAYDLLRNLEGDPRKRAGLLVDVLIKWFFVFNVRGIFNAMIRLLRRHEQEALAIGDKSRLGMYYCCMGWALQRREQLKASYEYLLKAEELSRSSGDDTVCAYAAACRIWTCTDLGRLDEAVEYGLKARQLTAKLKPDQELIRINLTGLAIAYWFRGESGKCREIGDALLNYGDHGADIRSTSDGYLVHGMSRFVAGDYDAAIDFCHLAIGASVGLVHSINSKFLLAYAYISKGQIDAAEKVLAEIIRFASRSGYEYLGTAAEALSGMIALAQGHLRTGLATIMGQMQAFDAGGKRYHYLTFEYLLGKVYLQIALREGGLTLSQIFRNFTFLVQHAPRSGRRAEKHFLKTIPMAAEVGARTIEGQAHLDLGRLYARRRNYDPARRHLAQSIALFRVCEADKLLEEAQAFTRSLPDQMA